MPKLIIRHPTSAEIASVGAILFDAFIDKFSYIFEDNVARGRIAFLDIYQKILRPNDLKNIIVAVREQEVVGKLELHTQSRFPTIGEFRAIHAGLARHFGTLRALRQALAILMLTGTSAEGRVGYVASIGVRPDAQDHHIGLHLLRAAEKLASRRHVNAMTLYVILRNARAQHLYRKIGYQDVRVFSLPIFHWFMGVHGYIYMKKQLKAPISKVN
jgi:ribosomal protein S18 acetylase RimI-like enzyme